MSTSKPIVVDADVSAFVPSGKGAESAQEEPVERSPEAAFRGAEPAVDIEAVRASAAEEVRRELMAVWAQEREQDHVRWKTLEASINAYFDALDRQVADELVRISLGIAEAIVRRTLPDRAMVLDLLRSSLEHVTDLQGARVRLHPEDESVLRKIQEAASTPGISGPIELHADPSLRRGDMLIETRSGFFDARLDTRLQVLREELLERIRHEHSDET